MTAPGGLIAATGSGRPAVKRDASLLPLVLIFSLISCWTDGGFVSSHTLKKEILTNCHCFGSHVWAHGVVSAYAAALYRT